MPSGLRSQITIVIVTHNMQQAAGVSQNRASFLATDKTPGHVVEAGPTELMFDSPSNPFSASKAALRISSIPPARW
ncbi:MAG TPA: hypothetical protein VFQ44_28490 [Streptosporangiaceae bacterium]|nr:hypothetical protein [Streptosporangiaceae bacterium]